MKLHLSSNTFTDKRAGEEEEWHISPEIIRKKRKYKKYVSNSNEKKNKRTDTKLAGQTTSLKVEKYIILILNNLL